MNSSRHSSDRYSPLARDRYDHIKVGSIDATDDDAHDKALLRAHKSHYKPNEKVVGDPKCTIFVARLNPHTTEETIQRFFSKFGSILRHRLVRDIITGFSRRYAFIEYKDRRSASKAYHEAHRAVIDDRQILVDWEFERTMDGFKPRRYGGGFGGRKESGQLRFGGRDRPWKKPIELPMKSYESRRDRRESGDSYDRSNDRRRESKRNDYDKYEKDHHQDRHHREHHDREHHYDHHDREHHHDHHDRDSSRYHPYVRDSRRERHGADARDHYSNLDQRRSSPPRTSSYRNKQ